MMPTQPPDKSMQLFNKVRKSKVQGEDERRRARVYSLTKEAGRALGGRPVSARRNMKHLVDTAADGELLDAFASKKSREETTNFLWTPKEGEAASSNEPDEYSWWDDYLDTDDDERYEKIIQKNKRCNEPSPQTEALCTCSTRVSPSQKVRLVASSTSSGQKARTITTKLASVTAKEADGDALFQTARAARIAKRLQDGTRRNSLHAFNPAHIPSAERHHRRWKRAGLLAQAMSRKRTGSVTYVKICNSFSPAVAPDSPFMKGILCHEMNLSNIGLDYKRAVALAAALRVNTVIKSLDLSGNMLGEQGGIAIAEGLLANKTLHTLNLSHNNIGTAAGMDIVAVVGVKRSALTDLDMSSCGLRDPFVQELVNALLAHNCLRRLQLSRNLLTSRGMNSLKYLYETQDCKISDLALGWNDIRPVGGISLIEGFSTQGGWEEYQLTHVELPFCGLDDSISEQLGDWLGANPPLVSLDLSHNRLGVESAKIISMALCCNTTLFRLNLSFNQLTTQGVCFFIDVLRQRNRSIADGSTDGPAVSLRDLHLENSMDCGDEQWVKEQIDLCNRQDGLTNAKVEVGVEYPVRERHVTHEWNPIDGAPLMARMVQRFVPAPPEKRSSRRKRRQNNRRMKARKGQRASKSIRAFKDGKASKSPVNDHESDTDEEREQEDYTLHHSIVRTTNTTRNEAWDVQLDNSTQDIDGNVAKWEWKRQGKADLEVQSNNEDNDSDELETCDECGERFAHSHDLQRHAAQTGHRTGADTDELETCDEYGESFAHSHDLQRHAAQTGHRTGADTDELETCDEYGESFAHSHDLQRHAAQTGHLTDGFDSEDHEDSFSSESEDEDTPVPFYSGSSPPSQSFKGGKRPISTHSSGYGKQTGLNYDRRPSTVGQGGVKSYNVDGSGYRYESDANFDSTLVIPDDLKLKWASKSAGYGASSDRGPRTNKKNAAKLVTSDKKISRRRRRGSTLVAEMEKSARNRPIKKVLAFDITKSVFQGRPKENAGVSKDTDGLLRRAFEMDWVKTKIRRLVTDDLELARLKELLRASYAELRYIHKRYSRSQTHAYQMGLNDITAFCQELEIVDEGKFAPCNQGSIDTMFIATNNIDASLEGNTKTKFDDDHAISRTELLEFVVRLSIAKFIKSTSVTDSPAEAFVHFRDSHLSKISQDKKASTNDFRTKRLYTNTVNDTIRQSESRLMRLFKRCCKSDSGQKWMNMEEWKSLVEHQGLDQQISDIEIRGLFLDSKITVVDEDNTVTGRQLNWYDFLEAITRLAFAKDWVAEEEQIAMEASATISNYRRLHDPKAAVVTIRRLSTDPKALSSLKENLEIVIKRLLKKVVRDKNSDGIGDGKKSAAKQARKFSIKSKRNKGNRLEMDVSLVKSKEQAKGIVDAQLS